MTIYNEEVQLNENADEKQAEIELTEEEEQLIREKIKLVIESRELSSEQQSLIAASKDEKQLAIEKIRTVLEAEGLELEKAAQVIAPEFDYKTAAEELELEEAAAEVRVLYGIELYWDRLRQEQAEEPLPAELVSPSVYPREKYKAKTKWGRFFLQDNHHIVMGIWIAVFVLLIAIELISYVIPETVKVHYQSLTDLEVVIIETRARTVGDLVDELVAQGYDIDESDAVLPHEESAIKNNMMVQLMKATEAPATIAGVKTTIFMIPGTVEDNLKFNDIPYDEDDEVSPRLDTEVTAKTRIKLDEVHYKYKEKKEKVAAVNKVILDPSLGSGIEKRTKGNDGKAIMTYRYKYVNGKKVSTKKNVKEWIVEAHDNSLRLGTSATGHSGEYVVVRTFTANCTAYTARKGAHGAIGEPVRRGTCAVDPSFVPYRSTMWIEGYGFAYANDCGGAVKGNVVDLFMNSYSECIHWGRRNMTAYVLQPLK